MNSFEYRRNKESPWEPISRGKIPTGVLMAFDFIPLLDNVRESNGEEWRKLESEASRIETVEEQK